MHGQRKSENTSLKPSWMLGYRLVIGSEIPQPSVLPFCWKQDARTAGLLKFKLSFFSNQNMFTCNREMIMAECLTAIKGNCLFTERRPVLQSVSAASLLLQSTWLNTQITTNIDSRCS